VRQSSLDRPAGLPLIVIPAEAGIQWLWHGPTGKARGFRRSYDSPGFDRHPRASLSLIVIPAEAGIQWLWRGSTEKARG